MDITTLSLLRIKDRHTINKTVTNMTDKQAQAQESLTTKMSTSQNVTHGL
jgi:hypothetical protein